MIRLFLFVWSEFRMEVSVRSVTTSFYYSECSFHLPCVFLSSQISVFLTSSFSLSDQSDAGEWDQVCGSRACGTEVRQRPCAVPLRSTLQCLGQFALINLIYYFLPWLTNAENSRPLIKAQLFWQATDEPAEPCAQWLYKFSHCLSNEYHFVSLVTKANGLCKKNPLQYY